MRPSHKNEIIALYESGLDEVVIALQTHHAQTSVGRYIRDYERVKLLLARHTPIERIPQLIDMRPSMVQAYVDLVCQHQPDLMPEKMSLSLSQT